MARELKFRAWDEGFKKWDYFTFDNISTYLATLQLHLLNGDIFYQFTNLKDNTKWGQLTFAEKASWLKSGKTKEEWNGREIYEGDIVRIDKEELGTEKNQVCTIEWDGGCSYQIESDEAGSYNLSDISESSLKVVGNIYQNKDLLEVRP